MVAATVDGVAVAGFVARWMTFAGIVGSIGAVVFRLVVIGRLALDRELTEALGRQTARAASIGCAAIVPAAAVRLFVQTAGMRFPDDPWLGVAWHLVRATPWGHLWIAQVSISVLLALSFASAARDWRPGWLTGVPLSLALAATPSLGSHAMSEHSNRAITVSADVLHVLGAGAWLGTLFMFGLALRHPNLRDMPGRDERSPVPLLLQKFSPIALIGAGLVVGSGVASSLAHIERWTMLTGSDYGRLILLKVAVVGVVTLFGWRNWKRLTPQLEATGATALGRSIAVELIAAALVLAVTAILVITPPPMMDM